MRINYGTYRIAILLPWLGLAVKIPRIHLIRYLVGWPKAVALGKRVALQQFLLDLTWSIEISGSMRNLLLKGIWDNWREFVYWIRSHPRFVVPTYFSFFGLFNLQPIGKPFRGNFLNVIRRLRQLAGETAFDLDLHHFYEEENYCFWHGRLRIIDYGHNRTQQILERWRTILSQGFYDFHPD